MRVGIRLVQHLADPTEIVELAALAERCGLDEVWIPHDPLMTNAWALTSAIAARTERITVGSIGTNPYTTDPSEVATYLATLDLLSGGRAALGLGLHTGEMVRWLGYDPGDLGPRLRGCVDAIRELLRGETVTTTIGGLSWGGECALRFEPYRPRPPIHIAAFGPELLRLAGAIGDGAMPMATPPESVGPLVADVRAGAAASGRNPAEVEVIACVWLSLDPDPEAAAKPLRRMIATFGPYLEPRALAELGLGKNDFAPIRHLVDGGRLDGAAALVTPPMLGLALAGAPEQVVERILALGAAGVTNVSLGGPLGPDPRAAIRLLGEVVAPAVRTRSA